MEKTTSAHDHAHNGAVPKQRVPYDYGGNPLAHVATNDPELRLQAFGGEFQPGLYRPPTHKFANPAPLGLSAFALTTFVLSLINVKTRNIPGPNIVVALAFGYGGLVQLLAGMWSVSSYQSVTPRIANKLQGNGSWQYLWCHSAIILRWFLAVLRHHSDPRWFRNRICSRLKE
jgi:hypothetical protein